MSTNFTDLQKQFLQFFPQGNPTGMTEADLNAFIRAGMGQLPGATITPTPPLPVATSTGALPGGTGSFTGTGITAGGAPSGISTGGPGPGARPGESPFAEFFATGRPAGALGLLGGPGTFENLGPWLSQLGGERLNDLLISPVGQILQRNIAEYLNQLGLQPFFGQQTGLADFLAGQLGGRSPFQNPLEALVGMLSQGQAFPLQDQLIQMLGSLIPSAQGAGAAGANAIQSILGGGLPGQRELGISIQQLLEGGGSPAEQAVTTSIIGQLMGGGLSPEFVDAARRRILGPSKEALLGDITRRGLRESGIRDELVRRQEADFNRDLMLQSLAAQQQAQQAGIQAAGLPLQRFQGALGGITGLGGLGTQAAATGANIGQALLNQIIGGLGGISGQGLQQLTALGGILGGERGRATGQQQAFAQLLNNLIQGAGGQAFNIAQLGQQGLLGGIQSAFAPLGNIMNFNLAQEQLRQGKLGQLGTALGQGVAALLPFLMGLSSKKYKKEIRKVDPEEALEKVNSVRLVKFKYRNGDPKHHYGIILEESDPAFSTPDGERIDVDIVGLLIGSVQAQQKEIWRLKKKLRRIEQSGIQQSS